MSENSPLDLCNIDPAAFDIATFDDELRVDQLCVRLLLAVRDRLLAANGSDPLTVGALCQGADYFLREFVIAECADNLLLLPPERIRQFAGHWYIVRNLEPNSEELATILTGISACYQFLAEVGAVERQRAEAIGAACTELPDYTRRIESFWAITGDGFERWRAACPLPRRQ